MKYILSFTIALLLCLGALCATEAYATSPFNDVKAGTELGSSIQALQGKSIISGYPDGTFKPNSPLTRAHASKIIALALELDSTTVQNPNFKDVSTAHSQYRYIAALANAGIINGNNGYFNPQAPLTRGQMAKILVRAYNLQGTATLPFTDTKGKSVEKDVEALFANGITKGVTETLYGVNNAVTRGQMVIFIHRTVTLKQAAAIQEQSKPETKAEPAAPSKPTPPQNATLVASDITHFKGTFAIEKDQEIVIQRIGETYGASTSTHNDTFSFFVHSAAKTVFYVTTYNRKTGEYANNGRYYYLLPYVKDDDYVMDVYLSHVAIEDTTIIHTNYSSDEKMTITDANGTIVDPSRYTVKRDGTVSSLVVGMLPVGEYVFHFDLKNGQQKTVAYKTFYEGAKIQFYPYNYFADSKRLTIPYDGHWIYGSILDVAQPNTSDATFISYNERELTIQLHNMKEVSTTDLTMTILQRDDQRKVKIKSAISITPFAHGYIYNVESVYVGEAD